jgi:phosphatidylglycerophosphate synthase
MLTFLGIIINILGYAVMLWFDTSLSKPIPQWTYFFAAACLFIYQTLDAIDGKQAKRTGSSSPLG